MSKFDGTHGGTTIYRPYQRPPGNLAPLTDEHWKAERDRQRAATGKAIRAQRKARLDKDKA